MTDSQNPGVSKNVRTGEAAGQPTQNDFTFDFAASYAPATLTTTAPDRIQIGEVPAGEKLVPHLTRLSIPQIDSNGTPTGDYQVGTDDDPDALKGSAAAETAVVLFGEDWLVPATPIGSPDEPTPIYLTIVNNVATVAATGKIVFNQVTVPWDQTVDG